MYNLYMSTVKKIGPQSYVVTIRETIYTIKRVRPQGKRQWYLKSDKSNVVYAFDTIVDAVRFIREIRKSS